jgi:acetate kinase
MPEEVACILTVNAGSSSLKFALFPRSDLAPRRLTGKFENIGLPDAKLKVMDFRGKTQERPLPLPNHAACLPQLFSLLSGASIQIEAIGHRVVHGGPRYHDPQVIDQTTIAELKRISDFAPEHLPVEIQLIEALVEHFPGVLQVACFDTAFHRTLDPVAKVLPIPRKYFGKGIYRYGFHGLSYSYLMRELGRLGGEAAAQGGVILAHLGNGASMAAVRGGRSIDTTMAFTPAAGLVMSTRSGDLDPGLASYLMRTERMTAERFHHMINEEAGLLGVSEISPDTRELLKREHVDSRAAEALALFCYQARKWIGALAAALGGLDTLVFSGGIGENASEIRARICHGLQFLGVELDENRNAKHEAVISKDGAAATVRVIRTDEELFIAQSVGDVLSKGQSASL